MERMSLEELQACSCVASGWARRSFFVFFSYAFRAVLRMDWKLEDDVDVDADGVCDIVNLG